MQPAKLFKYSNKRLQVFFVDDDGYPIGLPLSLEIPDPNAVDAGEVYHAYVLQGYVTATPAAREVDTASDQADGKNYGDIDMGISSYGTLEITLSMRDELFFEMIRRVTANTTVSSAMRISSKNNTTLNSPNMGIIITDLVRDEKTGIKSYEHTVYNKGTFTVTQEAEGNQSGGVNPSPLTITFKPVPSDRFVLTGMLYSAMGLNVEEGLDTDSPVNSPYQFTFSTFIKDGTDTTFITKYKPLVSGATVGGVNVYSSEGVQGSLTSYALNTGLATMSAVGTSGHRALLAYATEFALV